MKKFFRFIGFLIFLALVGCGFILFYNNCLCFYTLISNKGKLLSAYNTAFERSANYNFYSMSIAVTDTDVSKNISSTLKVYRNEENLLAEFSVKQSGTTSNYKYEGTASSGVLYWNKTAGEKNKTSTFSFDSVLSLCYTAGIGSTNSTIASLSNAKTLFNYSEVKSNEFGPVSSTIEYSIFPILFGSKISFYTLGISNYVIINQHTDITEICTENESGLILHTKLNSIGASQTLSALSDSEKTQYTETSFE